MMWRYVKSTDMTLVIEYPTAWWQAQAAKIPQDTCPKCQAGTTGAYVLDAGDGWVYRAVIERCGLCGWQHIYLTQENYDPLVWNPQPRGLKPVGVPGVKETGRWSAYSLRYRKRRKVVKLPGQALKRPSTATGRRKGSANDDEDDL